MLAIKLVRLGDEFITVEIDGREYIIDVIAHQLKDKKFNNEVFNNTERKILIDLICEKQTDMIVADHNLYESNEYIQLEQLKVKIKNS